MSTFTLQVNGRSHEVDAAPETPLLWVLRDNLDLVGTKFGCGIGQCAACTVHLDGTPARACLTLAMGERPTRPTRTHQGLPTSSWQPLPVPVGADPDGPDHDAADLNSVLVESAGQCAGPGQQLANGKRESESARARATRCAPSTSARSLRGV